jgi:catechol 2,3-dioxygenase-like lactoylglutathione lyase family enzyme
MFSHVVLGADDIPAAKKFYDAILTALGHQPGMLTPDASRIIYQSSTLPLMITKPLNGETATNANGGTIGLLAPSKDAVDAFHAAALANGGSDAGAPGPRDAIPGSYAAYVCDISGNKLVAWCAPALG